MAKTILSVVIAIVILDFLWIAVRIGVLVAIEMRRQKKNRNPYGYQSSYREAFIMECSEKDIKGNPYAEQLDKCIKKIDRETSRLEKAQNKSRNRLSNMKLREK